MEKTSAGTSAKALGLRPKVWVTLVLAWGLAALTALALLGAYNLSRLGVAFDTEARTLHRIISQRAEQHDAHLTSLAAVVGNAGDIAPTMRPITDAVLRFYPRITAIDVVSLQPSARVTFTTRETGARLPDTQALAPVVDGLEPGQTIVLPARSEADYALVKRIPSGAIIMTIDGLRLSETDGALEQGSTLILKTPSGQQIARIAGGTASRLLLPSFSFEKELGSRSQPLGLQIERRPTIGEVLPAAGSFLALAGTGAAALLGAILLRARREAGEARGRAAFHAQDARFAHAARVNTVGEMASGIVHELTQPLTAILSQSQAGLRMARNATTPEEIVGVLEANARGAKRAGDILARLRDYMANRPPELRPTALNGLVRHVVELTQAELDQGSITLRLDLSSTDPVCLVDQVSIEQVVHNLLLNAIDAVAGLPVERRVISVSTQAREDGTMITVRDLGDGIPAENLPRLFEPFFTTKSGGKGLGLPLCERLVESFGGQIRAANDPRGGAVFTVNLPPMRLPEKHR